MTLTAPACPAAQSLPVEVRDKARVVEGVTDAKVEVVWDPPWTKDRMSDAAKLELGMLWPPPLFFPIPGARPVWVFLLAGAGGAVVPRGG